MEGFPSIKGAKIDKNLAKKLQNYFKSWSMIAVGKTRTHITPAGGIHYTGKETMTNSISFEVKRGGGYVMVSLFEYPKGLVFHAHIYFSDMDRKTKDGWEKVLKSLYEEVKKLLEVT